MSSVSDSCVLWGQVFLQAENDVEYCVCVDRYKFGVSKETSYGRSNKEPDFETFVKVSINHKPVLVLHIDCF